MKKSELFFSAIQVPVDYAMIILAGLTAFSVRNVPQILALKPKLYQFSLETYWKILLIVAPLFLVIYAFYGLYRIKVTRKFWGDIAQVFFATSTGLLVIIVAIFLKREWFSSRFIILASWMIATFYVVIARILLHTFQKWLLRKWGVGVHRVLLIGRNGKMNEIALTIRRNKNLGYKVIDQINNASLSLIKEIRKNKGIDEIILCEPFLTDDEQEKLIDYCAIHNIAYRFLPTTLQTPRFEFGVLNGDPIIEVKHTPLDGWGKIWKRVFDIIFSFLAIVLLSPILILVAVLIKLESRGPIIYKNERVGADGKKFFVYKFRYMKWEYCVTKENEHLNEALKLEMELIKKQSVRKGPLYKIKNDPRKTLVGSFIERYSIDELPQFFNVLFGNMSIVGPRPHQEREVEKYREYHRRLLTIKPGITGMAQISGRSDLDFENEYKVDLYYIENWSLLLDIQICLKTAGVLMKKRKNI